LGDAEAGRQRGERRHRGEHRLGVRQVAHESLHHLRKRQVALAVIRDDVD
jgi:hypothetical protein